MLVGADRTAQWVKYLWLKQQDLSSVHQHLDKNKTKHVHRNAGEVETGGFPRTHWPTSLVELVRSRFTETLPQNVRDSQERFPASTSDLHMHTQMNVHTNTVYPLASNHT